MTRRCQFAERFAALLTAAVLLAFLPACDENGGQAQQPPAEPPAEEPSVNLAEMGYDEGDFDESVVWVVEFSDFGCIHCAGFHVDTYPALHEEFVASGEVAWKYIPISIGGFPNGDEATVAGHCAGGQDRFASMRDLLFERRDEWLSARPGEAAGVFRGYADELGLDPDAFEVCYEGDEAREALAEANRVAAQVGVGGTPTFIVQGFPVQGAPPLEQFREALREIVDQVRAEQPGDG